MKKLILLIIFFLYLKSTHAQALIDIASLRRAYSPSSGIHIGNNEKNNSDYTFFGLTLPIKINKTSTILTFSPYIDQWNVHVYDTSYTEIKSIGLPVTLSQKLSKNVSFSSTIIFRRNTRNLSDSRANQIGTLSTINFQLNNKLRIKPGIYYNKEFWGNFFLPIFGIEYYPHPQLKIWGNIPANLFVERKMNEQWYLSFTLRGVNNSYMLNDNRYLHINETQLGIISDWYIYKNLVLGFEMGHTILRNLKTGRMDLIKSYIDDKQMNNNLYFRVYTSYRIRLIE